MPGLLRAFKLQKRAARVGYDWPDVEGAFAKLTEEYGELEDELEKADLDEEKLIDELGDVLFSTVNVARKLNIDPEAALRQGNLKFETRFGYIEEALEKQAMLEQQMAEPVAPAEGAVVPNDGPRASASNGGYGLHVASYELQESVSPGLRNIERRIPVLTNGRPIKIANATVRGRNFLRLIIGQFDRQSDAAAECQQALLLIDFCEVIAFEGEDY